MKKAILIFPILFLLLPFLGEEIKKYAKYLWKCKKKNKFTETHKIYML